MPDTLSLSAVSLGLLAGIVSGVCYLVANGITWPKNDPPSQRKQCLLPPGPDDDVCRRCGGDKQGGLIPCVCRYHKPVKFESGAWFLRQVQRAISLMPWTISTEKLEQIEEECEGRESPGPSEGRELRNVREFLETLSAQLAGGPLEGTRIAPLYDHPAYLPPRNASPSNSGSTPSNGASGAHAQLKRLVARVVEEAAALPALARYAAEPANPPSIESSTYEDLLATAILNKVIERYQTENGSGGRSSGIHSASASPTPSSRSSPRSLNSRHNRDISPPVIERYQTENGSGGRSSRIHSASASSTPSERSSPRSLSSRHNRDISPPVIERYQTENGSGGRSSRIHSASASSTPSERSSPRSLSSRHNRDISPSLPEEEDVSDWEEGETTDDALEMPRRVPFPEFGGDIVHQENKDRDFDEVSGSDMQAVDGTWEENWLFQKKKIKTMQSVPVPMLVPNSNTEYRALIGDRDADDTTDLSDNASDPEEDQGHDYKSDIKRVLESKHVIGGKPKLEELDFEPDSLTILDEAKEFERFNGNLQEDEHLTDAINNEIRESITAELKDYSNLANHFDEGQDSILILGIDSGPPQKAEFSLKEIHRKGLNNNDDVLFRYDKMDNMSKAEESLEVFDSLSSVKGSTNTLSRHECEGEYEETVTIPVQRYADSLRRKHFDDEPQQIPTRDTDKDVNGLIPGSIAYRERQKWLNYVEMPNNPYSPEAIKKRLSTKSTSSLFDMITAKNNEVDDDKNAVSADIVDSSKIQAEETNIPERDEVDYVIKSSPAVNGDTLQSTIDTRVASQSPKILKDVLAEEVPQYKRYGRDYYIKEAKASAGGRKRNGSNSDISSLSSLNKSTSLDNIDTEFATPGLLIKQFNTIAKNQEYTKFAVDQVDSITTTCSGNNEAIMIEYEESNDDHMFSAKPALVSDDDTDKKFEEILEFAYKTNLPLLQIENKEIDEPEKSPTNHSVDESYISSSSMEDSIKIYNVQTGEIMKCKPEDNISPRYETEAETNDDFDTPDKAVIGETDDKLVPVIKVAEEPVIIKENIEEDTLEANSEIEDILSQLPKVKELAKKFVSMENLNEPTKLPQPYSWRRRSKENILNGDNEKERQPNKLVYMHSLTARSISKEFREELKLSMATPLTVPGGSKEIPEGTEEVVKESSRPGSPLPEPGTIKTKLAFFESLKSKFSNK